MKLSRNIGGDYSISIYGCDQGIHMMVFQNDKALACRKTSCNKMAAFLQMQSTDIFKGNLRFSSQPEGIAVYINGENIDTIPKSLFVQAIHYRKNMELEYFSEINSNKMPAQSFE